MKPVAALIFGLAVLAIQAGASSESSYAPEQVRLAVKRSLTLMIKSLEEYPRHEKCFSCHHQGVPMLALSQARSHGYVVEDKSLEAAVRHTKADLGSDLEKYLKGEGQPGGVDRAGYALLALKCGGAKSDSTTSAVAGFLLQRDRDRDFWRTTANRPPQEASSFTSTLLAIRALKSYGALPEKVAIKTRIDRARQWLEQAPAKDTEDRVFRLWGLKEAGSADEAVNKAVLELLGSQRDDGGWAQLPGGSSDAYATGSALTVMRLTGVLREDAPEFQRGAKFLLQNQLPDGSWHVISRSKPFQPYFESGFPHGTDQFISMAATGWATAALALATGRQ